MIHIIRITCIPILFCLSKIIKNLSFFIGLSILTIIMFYSKDFIFKKTAKNVTENNKFTISPNKSKQIINNQEIIKEIIIKKGDSIYGILKNQNLSNTNTQRLVKLSNSEKISKKLKIGQKIIFIYKNKEQKLTLQKMIVPINNLKSIHFIKSDNKFITKHFNLPLKKLIVQYDTTINSSVISSLRKTGLDNKNITKLINTYSHRIDFQRKIRTGDKITVITEKFVTKNNKLSHHGKILFSSLKTRGVKYNIYNYSPTGQIKNALFFSESGNSIKGTLLRTPVDVVRISSPFGYRKHPILGYSIMHKGVDFVASVGTPIRAAGDGVVKFIGWKSGYGRFLLIKHNKTLSTAYAHSSRFAKKLRKGSKVKQGDIIAYVGVSGRVTGPHLHYEVRINGKQVNPMKFKSTPGIRLTGSKMAKFNRYKKQIHNLSKQLRTNIELSANNIKTIQL